MKLAHALSRDHQEAVRDVNFRDYDSLVMLVAALTLVVAGSGCAMVESYTGLRLTARRRVARTPAATAAAPAAWPAAPTATAGTAAIPAIPATAATALRGPSAAQLIEEALHGRGLAFGTDGSVEALYSYTRTRHRLVPATDAQAGDIVFFNTTHDKEHCGSHGGIVEDVGESGALRFREYRAGRVRRSLVDPRRPHVRRDESGRIINTFLRPKSPDDPAGTGYFAGEMLCAVARVAP